MILRSSRFPAVFLSICLVCSLRAASVTLSPIYVSIGPDANTSPSYAAYTTNAQAGAAAGSTSVGGNIQTTPSAYNVVGTGATAAVSGASITNTPFPSWLGVADPHGSLTTELGNMLYWNIVFTGTNISLNQITVTQSSTDPADSFGDPTQAGGLFTETFQNYSPAFVGITAAGTKITSGANTQQVNEIVITGFAASQSGYGVITSGTDAQRLQQINNALALSLGSYSIGTCFYYGSASSANPNTCNVTSVTNPLVSVAPEPRSLLYTSFAISFLLPLRLALRRRRAR